MDHIFVPKNISICDLICYGYCILLFVLLHRVMDTYFSVRIEQHIRFVPTPNWNHQLFLDINIFLFWMCFFIIYIIINYINNIICFIILYLKCPVLDSALSFYMLMHATANILSFVQKLASYVTYNSGTFFPKR